MRSNKVKKKTKKQRTTYTLIKKKTCANKKGRTWKNDLNRKKYILPLYEVFTIKIKFKVYM